MGIVTVQQIKYSKTFGVDVEEIEYTNVEKIIFDYQFKDEEHTAEPCFILVLRYPDKWGNEERKTATFWCSDTQIIIEE